MAKQWDKTGKSLSPARVGALATGLESALAALVELEGAFLLSPDPLGATMKATVVRLRTTLWEGYAVQHCRNSKLSVEERSFLIAQDRA